MSKAGRLSVNGLALKSVSSISIVLSAVMAQSIYADTAFSSESSWMLGDWKGQRTALSQHGYDFSLGYTGESATLLDSSRDSDHQTEFSGQLALGAQLDLEKILGWQDTEANITVTWRDGRNLSNTSEALSGQMSSVQEVWGRGQTWRLTDLWIKKKFFDEKLDIKVGRFGEGEDFNSFDCNFQNLALCGSQMGNWAGDQWYNWPVSQWAARVKYQLSPELYTQVGVYEYNPENLERGKGFNLSTDGSHGALIPMEVVWQPQTNLPAEYRAGYLRSTVDAQTINNASKTDHRQGFWLSGKQQLTQHADDATRGLTAFFNATWFDEDTNAVVDMQNLGLSYKGLADHRPQDEIALGFSRIHLNEDLDNRDVEFNTELYYGIHVNNWLTVRPNVQYISHIGAIDDESDDAWVGGIKFMTAF